uniref:ubiquitinyl hydrolase 1 n=1 Tax=viral metagenome TaxID=1070528 RepID=A0A6C0DYW1_9ZZZZ
MINLYNNEFRKAIDKLDIIIKKSIRKLYGGVYFDNVQQQIDRTQIEFPQEMTKELHDKIRKIDATLNTTKEHLDKIDTKVPLENIEKFNKFIEAINKKSPTKDEKKPYTLLDYWKQHFEFTDNKARTKSIVYDDIINIDSYLTQQLKTQQLRKSDDHKERDMAYINFINDLFTPYLQYETAQSNENVYNVKYKEQNIGTIKFTTIDVGTSKTKIINFKDNYLVFMERGNFNSIINLYKQEIENYKQKITIDKLMSDLMSGGVHPHDITEVEYERVNTSIQNIMAYYDKIREQMRTMKTTKTIDYTFNLTQQRLESYILFNIYMLNMFGTDEIEIYKYINKTTIMRYRNKFANCLEKINKEHISMVEEKYVFFYVHFYYIVKKLDNFLSFLLEKVFNKQNDELYIDVLNCSGVILEDFVLFNHFKKFIDDLYKDQEITPPSYASVVEQTLEQKPKSAPVSALVSALVSAPVSKPKITPISTQSKEWDCQICTFKNESSRDKCEICENSRGKSSPVPVVNEWICYHCNKQNNEGICSTPMCSGKITTKLIYNNVYFQLQRGYLCGLHAINNMAQRDAYTQQSLDTVCQQLKIQRQKEIGISMDDIDCFSAGKYSYHVLIEAIKNLGYTYTNNKDLNKRPQIKSLFKPSYFNKTNSMLINLGNGYHWVSVTYLTDGWYYFDSLKDIPLKFQTNDELVNFINNDKNFINESPPTSIYFFSNPIPQPQIQIQTQTQTKSQFQFQPTPNPKPKPKPKPKQ